MRAHLISSRVRMSKNQIKDLEIKVVDENKKIKNLVTCVDNSEKNFNIYTKNYIVTNKMEGEMDLIIKWI